MNLIEFLKKYSKINNDFIEDFFGLYDINNKFEYNIDLDIVCKWLNIRKDNIKKTLLYSYQEKVDYIITKNKDNVKAGAPKEIILLTPKCFKILSMSSRSKKAVLVREYYYELEQILDKYKDYIINGLKDKIEKLENNQKPTSFRFIKNKTQQINLHFFNIFILSKNYIFKFFCVAENNKKIIFLLFEMNEVNR
jgi:hypothetical protein